MFKRQPDFSMIYRFAPAFGGISNLQLSLLERARWCAIVASLAKPRVLFWCHAHTTCRSGVGWRAALGFALVVSEHEAVAWCIWETIDRRGICEIGDHTIQPKRRSRPLNDRKRRRFEEWDIAAIGTVAPTTTRTLWRKLDVVVRTNRVFMDACWFNTRKLRVYPNQLGDVWCTHHIVSWSGFERFSAVSILIIAARNKEKRNANNYNNYSNCGIHCFTSFQYTRWHYSIVCKKCLDRIWFQSENRGSCLCYCFCKKKSVALKKWFRWRCTFWSIHIWASLTTIFL